MQMMKKEHALWSMYLLLLFLSLWILPILDRAERSYPGGATQWTSFLLKRISAVHGIPAADKANGDIIKKQDRDRAGKGLYQTLKLTLNNGPETTQWSFAAKIDGSTYKQAITSGAAEIGPLALTAKEARIWIEWKRTGFLQLFDADVTRKTDLQFEDLAGERQRLIKLERLEDFQGNTSTTANLYVAAKLVKFDPEERSGNDGDASTPRKITFRESGKYRYTHQDSISFLSKDAIDYYVTETPKQYTALIVVSDSDPRDFLRCVRTDTNEAIGTYSGPAGAFAAIIDKSVPLQLTMAVSGVHDDINYRIYAVTGDENKSKNLFLWFVENSGKSAQLPALSNEKRLAGLVWLIDSFDLRMKDRDVQGISGPDRKMLLQIAERQK